MDDITLELFNEVRRIYSEKRTCMYIISYSTLVTSLLASL